MFNKLKQFKELRDQAKTIQSALAQETITTEKKGLKVVMNGNMEITSFNILEEMDREKLEKNITEAVNETIKNAQKKMAMKVRDMGGFPGL